MKVVGFSFIRNAIHFDYPIVEAITSILPLCEYVVVAVGQSDDATLDLVKNIPSEKIRIIETRWDDTLRDGAVLAEETNKAFDVIDSDADWCIYIQGDEVLPETDIERLREAMEKWKTDKNTEGLLLHYRHFYGSYDYIGVARGWYRHEIRIIKNDKNIRSYRDAQGFRKHNKKLKVRLVEAHIHHYGWVRPPSVQLKKQISFNKYWYSADFIKEKYEQFAEFDYGEVYGLEKYKGKHPVVIQPRIKALNWHFDFDPTRRRAPFKERLSHFIEKITGHRVGEYKNYKLIGKA
jgi:hypothetical protein